MKSILITLVLLAIMVDTRADPLVDRYGETVTDRYGNTLEADIFGKVYSGNSIRPITSDEPLYSGPNSLPVRPLPLDAPLYDGTSIYPIYQRDQRGN